MRLAALNEAPGRRLAAGFACAVFIGLIGCVAALLGTRWDARTQSEDALTVHFLAWFLLPYAVGLAPGVLLARSVRCLNLYWRVAAWLLVGAALSAVFMVQMARVDAASPHPVNQVTPAFLLLVPPVVGGFAFASILKALPAGSSSKRLV